jgi:hypothetical protein
MEGFEKFHPQEDENEKARDEVESGDHFEKLYDQDEDAAGQRINEATGKKINNTPKVSGADEELTELEMHDDPAHTDVLPPLAEENDEAARWLRAQAAQLRKEKGDDFKKAA